jgi:hypothetical protein
MTTTTTTSKFNAEVLTDRQKLAVWPGLDIKAYKAMFQQADKVGKTDLRLVKKELLGVAKKWGIVSEMTGLTAGLMRRRLVEVSDGKTVTAPKAKRSARPNSGRVNPAEVTQPVFVDNEDRFNTLETKVDALAEAVANLLLVFAPKTAEEPKKAPRTTSPLKKF